MAKVRSKILTSCLAAAAMAVAGRGQAQSTAPASPVNPPVATATATEFWTTEPTVAASVQLDYLWINRSTPTSQSIFRSAAGATLFNGNDFDFGMDSGMQVKAIYQPTDGVGLEFRYLGIYSANASAAVAIPVGDSSFGTTPPTAYGGGPEGGTANFSYRTDLTSFDLNARRALSDRAAVVAGFRYLNLNEHVGNAASFVGLPDREFDNWNTSNQLWGLQVGGDATLWTSASGRLRVDGFVRAGIYANDAGARFNAKFTGGPVAGLGANDSDCHAAFTTDLGLTAGYQLNRNVWLRLGYQFLWISGVALASEQVDTTSQFNPPLIGRPSINYGDVFYNGVNAGVEFKW